jgi:eukaryotic-like serine/threonine-protein kinase
VVYQFDQFEVDDREFRLSNDGTPVQLEPKVLRLLLYLIENRNRLVRKQELLDKVWPDAIVTENALTRTIVLLRKALNEDSRVPRYLETVPTVGYRFIANVITENGVSSAPLAAPEVPAPTPARLAAEIRPANKWFPAAVILLLAAAAGGIFLYLRHGRKVLTEKDTVVLADFDNSTGDPVFDGTLRQGMTVQLEQSPLLSLISDERIQRTLALMAQPPDAHLTPAIGREICQRAGSVAVLDGSIALLGSQYVVGLRAVDCRTGVVIDAEQAQAARKEEVLSALSEIASRLRRRLGESLATVKQFDTPLAEATTPSLEALKAYSAAWKASTTVGPVSAIPLIKRAIELDPQFAMAHAMLGQVYGDIGEFALSAESTRTAYGLRNRASDRERFFITASYEVKVTGDLEKARQICETWAETYPRDVAAHGFLSGMILGNLGRYDEGLEEANRSVEADPDAGFPYNNVALTEVALGRLQEAESTLNLASQRRIEMPDFMVDRYQIAFLKGDQAGMDRIAALAMRDPGAEDTVSDQQAFALAWSGHLQQARAMSRRAVEMAQQAGELERSAQLEAGSAIREGFFGNADEARRDAGMVLKLSRGRDGEYGAAFALALTGGSSQAETLADDLAKRFPDATDVRFNYVPALRGMLALNRGDPAKAIELLQANVPYDLGTPSCSFFGFYGILYPIYVRGEAYLALHQGAQAAAEFQKIIDHPGIVISDPVGAMARLQIARAYAMSGNAGRAKAAYQNFLTLWKDADPDLPIFIQAKAEYAKLH